MKNLQHITAINFNESFDLADILTDSVFYPASGIDNRDIECLSNYSDSFVHVDYSTPKEVVEPEMRFAFDRLGYDLIGFKSVPREELRTTSFQPQNFVINDHERERLEKDFIADRFYCRNFIPFVFWAVYELNSNKIDSNEGKAKRFSLLHIGAEACATFEAIYVANKINPLAISILSPGEGYGDNWTSFRDPSFRFYQSLLLNYHNNTSAQMPRVLLTDMMLSESEPCFWPEFKFKNNVIIGDRLRLYTK